MKDVGRNKGEELVNYMLWSSEENSGEDGTYLNIINGRLGNYEKGDKYFVKKIFKID